MGRAVIVLEENDPSPYTKIVLDACLRDLAFDPQIVDNCEQYLLELIERSSDAAYIRAEITRALLRTPGESSYDLIQQFKLVGHFAIAGDLAARAALHQRFAELTANSALGENSDVLDAAAEQIIRLDGIEGFLLVAEKLGERALADPEEWFDDALLLRLEDKVGSETARRVTEKAARESHAVAAYLALVDEYRQRKFSPRPRSEAQALSYPLLKAKIEAAQRTLRYPWLRKWAATADPQNVEQAARDLLAEQDPTRVRSYLTLFQRFAFPFGPQPLIALTQGEDTEVARAALFALSNISHPLVRQLALQMLDRSSGPNTDMSVELLVSNYEPGDHLLIAQRLAREQDANTYHSLGMSALSVFEANPSPECVEVLLDLYDEGPCGLCRERCVDLLHRLGQLPEWMVKECQFDALWDLRVKARNYLADVRRDLRC